MLVIWGEEQLDVYLSAIEMKDQTSMQKIDHIWPKSSLIGECEDILGYHEYFDGIVLNVSVLHTQLKYFNNQKRTIEKLIDVKEQTHSENMGEWPFKSTDEMGYICQFLIREP